MRRICGHKSFLFVLFLFARISAADFPELSPPQILPFKTDPQIKKAWHLDGVFAYDAWKVSMGSPSTLVAVVDSGIVYNHPELSSNLRRKADEWPTDGYDDDENGFIDDVIGWDFVLKQYLPLDGTGHGTFMSYLIAGAYKNGVGGAGICPRCSLLPVRFIKPDGLGYTEDAISGIYYAIQEGASVINISFAGEGYDEDLKQALVAAGKNDVVVVTAASNDSVNLDLSSIYPAKFNLSHQLTVAAVDDEDELSDGSNWGKKTVHLAAPGVDLYGPDEAGGWSYGTGTSQAAAVVSGCVGVIRSVAPDLSAKEVVKIVKATVRRADSLKGMTQTEGVIDLEAAVECARHKDTPCLVP